MKRNFILTVVLLLAILATTVHAAALRAETAPHIKVIIDGVVQEIKDANGNKVAPIIIDGTTYLPLRSIANSFGKDVAWDEKTSTITIGTGIAVKPTAAPAPVESNKIGIAMPTKSLQRWNQDGAILKEQLEAKGYDIDLWYANNETVTQVYQIKEMIASGCKVLIIAAIDAESLTSVLAEAKMAGIKVISYDRLILNSDAVTYYATFDNHMVGTIQGKFIESKLGLDKGKGPFNIELITGDSRDTNAERFFRGAMEVLNPYIKSGKLVVQSGQTTFEQCTTESWRTDTAYDRFENILAANYKSGKKLDAVMASNDSTAQGVTKALREAGFTKDNFPIITGQDCDITSVRNMLAGYQSMSIFKDTRMLAVKVAEMANAIMKGTTVPVNDTKTYDNGLGIIPTYLCEPVCVTADNYKEWLLDSYYYSEEQLK